MADKKKNSSGGQKRSGSTYRTGADGRAPTSSRSKQGSAQNYGKPAEQPAKSGASKSKSTKQTPPKKDAGTKAASTKSTSPKKDTGKNSGKSKSGKKKNVGYAVSLLRADDDRSRIIRSCAKIMLVLVIVVVIVGLWRNRVDLSCVNISQCVKDLSYMNGSGEGFPLSVLGSRVIAEEELSGGMAVLTDTTMTVYNSSSKQAVSRAHYLRSPAMETSGRFALLFDISNTKYRLETVSDTLVEENSDYPIIGGAVARNGYFAIVKQGSSHASCFSSVEIFDKNGTSKNSWHSAEYYITDAALTADGKYIAMCGVSAKDGSLLSCIILKKVNSESIIAKYELPNSICLSLDFTNTGTLFAVCDNKLITVSNFGGSGEESKSEIPIDGELQTYDIDYDCGAAIYAANGTTDDKGTLTLYDARGNQRVTKEMNLHGIAVSLSKSGCCLLGRGGLEACKLSGEDIGTWEAEVAAADVLLIDSHAYVVEGISVSQVKLHSGMGQEE